ncbi:mannose-P-dolichol utilization defect 1 protein isoform X1 [Cinclus cinclus]|uniref:mannose-P-dolichol utilization defect 1 protein isoform X1 n=1 Tax=Cinclus cinclus TaxID=127875 RepID=UPI002E163CE4
MELLRPWLVPFLLPDHCFDQFFLRFQLLDVPCLKILLSKVLGYGIVAGSLLVKVPQLLKVWGSRSGRGLSLPSVLLELLALGGSVGYGWAKGFPFSTWGESLFLLLQNLGLLFLLLHFRGRSGPGLLLLAVFGAFLGILVSPLTPLSFVTALQALNLPIIILSRVLQIVTNARQGHTGQLSGVTTGLLFGGALARIFTSLTVRPLPKKNPKTKKQKKKKKKTNKQKKKKKTKNKTKTTTKKILPRPKIKKKKKILKKFPPKKNPGVLNPKKTKKKPRNFNSKILPKILQKSPPNPPKIPQNLSKIPPNPP